jgi:hypothetical protein
LGQALAAGQCTGIGRIGHNRADVLGIAPGMGMAGIHRLRMGRTLSRMAAWPMLA